MTPRPGEMFEVQGYGLLVHTGEWRVPRCCEYYKIGNDPIVLRHSNEMWPPGLPMPAIFQPLLEFIEDMWLLPEYMGPTRVR